MYGATLINAQGLQRAVVKGIAARQGVAALSHTAKKQLHNEILNLFKPPRTTAQTPHFFLPPTAVASTFQVHMPQMPEAAASAFAVEVDGKLFGVTASHVMTSVAQMPQRKKLAELEFMGFQYDTEILPPQMKFQLLDGSFMSVDILSWRLSNVQGSDVAVFEIPPAAQPYLFPLPISTQPVQPWQTASITGFAANYPLWLPNEEILFSGPLRMLLRNSSSADVNGMCGAPVLVNGNVVGLYVGYYSVDSLNFLLTSLPKDIPNNLRPPMLHRVSPISNIFPLIRELTGTNAELSGLPLKVLGHPIAVLRPEEQLVFVRLIRNGEIIDTRSPGDFLDSEHLENIFDLEENDILHLFIFPKTYTGEVDKGISYEVNVSTGQVTRRETP